MQDTIKIQLKSLLFLLVVGLLFPSVAKAQWQEAAKIELSSDSELSLLIASPIPYEIYTRFGHVGIRIKDPKNGIDHCFDYGIFSFEEPNFIWRFVKGETDFWIEAQDISQFTNTWIMTRNSGINELTVNLDSVEINRAWKFLCNNMLPKNRLYRYNFLYDNCATRAVMVLEKAISGKIAYKKLDKNVTWRELIDKCCQGAPWMKFGIDLVLGGDTDKAATEREQMFLPERLDVILPQSKIIMPDGSEKALIKERKVIFKDMNPLSELKNTGPSPLFALSVLLNIVIFISIYDLIRKKVSWIVDFFLFAIAGLAGILLFFMAFISAHPHTSPNFVLILLHPLHLFVLCPLLLIPKLRKWAYYYHLINFVLLTLFACTFWFLPQQLIVALWPFGTALGTLSLRWVIIKWKKNVR